MFSLFIVDVPLQEENTASLCKAFILACLTTVTFTAAYQLGHADYWKDYEDIFKRPAAAVYPSEAREENVSSYVIFVSLGHISGLSHHF